MPTVPRPASPVNCSSGQSLRSEPHHRLPNADVLAVAGTKHAVEVLALLGQLPWADRGGWRGSVRQLAGRLLELTGHTWNRDRLTKVLRVLVDAGALVMEKAGRWWTVFRLRRPKAVSTLPTKSRVEPPKSPPREHAPKAPAARPDEAPGRGRPRDQGQGLSALGSILGALARRHLDESQRAMVAARLATMPSHRPSESIPKGTLTTQAEAATALNVSVPSVKRARAVIDCWTPDHVNHAAEEARRRELFSQIKQLSDLEKRKLVSPGS